jgi:hypothetical protein
MKISEFNYKGKKREVVIIEEDEDNIKGIDMSYIEDSPKKSVTKAKAGLTDLSLEEENDNEKVLNNLFADDIKYFRHFKKDRIEHE